MSVARIQFRCLDNGVLAVKAQLTDSQESMELVKYFPQQSDVIFQAASLN